MADNEEFSSRISAADSDQSTTGSIIKHPLSFSEHFPAIFIHNFPTFNAKFVTEDFPFTSAIDFFRRLKTHLSGFL